MSEIELDTSWIVDFEQNSEIYSKFQEKEITDIKIKFYYIDINNTIKKIVKNKIKLIKPNLISKEELLYQIKNNIENKMKKEWIIIRLFYYHLKILK